MDGLDDEPGAIAILDIGGVDLGADQQTASIGHNVALTAPSLRWGRLVTLLAASPGSRLCRARGQAQPRGPPLSVVLTDWLSMTPADGWVRGRRLHAPAARVRN